MELPKKGVKWCSYRHAHLFYVSVFIFVNISEFKPNFMMHITVLSIMMPLLYMTGEMIGAEDADLIAPVLRYKTVKYEFRIPESSNQNIVYTGLNVWLAVISSASTKSYSESLMPEMSCFNGHHFFRVLEEEKNQSEHCIQYINCSAWTILEYKYEFCS